MAANYTGNEATLILKTTNQGQPTHFVFDSVFRWNIQMLTFSDFITAPLSYPEQYHITATAYNRQVLTPTVSPLARQLALAVLQGDRAALLALSDLVREEYLLEVR